MRTFFVLAGIFALTACALPVPEQEQQGFVPGRDLDAVSLVREGANYYQKSRFVEAEFAFRKALYLHPKAANVKANLAAALRAGGQYDEAEDILLSLNAAAPKSIEYLSSLARLYVEKRDYASARRYFTEAFELAIEKPDFAAASRFARSLSVVAFRIGDENSALCHSALATALNSDAENTARHARLFLATHRTAKGRDLVDTYLNQPGIPRDPAILHQLGMAQFALAEYRDAQESESAVLESDVLDRNIQAEAQLVAALSRRHLNEAVDEPLDTSIESASAVDAVAAAIESAIEATPEKASLYWPLPLLEEAQVIKAEKEALKKTL